MKKNIYSQSLKSISKLLVYGFIAVFFISGFSSRWRLKILKDGFFEILELHESTPYRHSPFDVWIHRFEAYYGPFPQYSLQLKDDRFYIIPSTFAYFSDNIQNSQTRDLVDRVFSGKLHRRVNSKTGQVEIYGTVDSVGIVVNDPTKSRGGGIPDLKWVHSGMDLFQGFEIKSFSLQANYSDLKRIVTYRPANVVDTSEGTFVIKYAYQEQDGSKKEMTKVDTKIQFKVREKKIDII